MAGQDMYRENIMDHYKNPRNYGALSGASVRHSGNNPLCGDEIEMTLVLNGSTIKDVRFRGRGCAISQASASMLTEEIKGKSPEFVKQMTRDDMIAMLGIPLTPARVKCAVLGMKVAQDGIRLCEGEKIAVTTTE